MSQDADRHADFIGINWGSSNFRAYRIAADGALIDRFAAPAGIAGLDRDGMIRQIAEVEARWPGHGPVYASGMIGSNVGWVEAPYAECPVDPATLAAAAIPTTIGQTEVMIVPGLACVRTADGAPDVLRGEEIELLGLMALENIGDGIVALPGTHTKWVRLQGGAVVEFLTSMSGEIYDRLTRQGLLASIVEDEADVNEAFLAGVNLALERRVGLASLLFGVRARVMRRALAKADAASMLRGILIGSDIADALALFGPFPDEIPLLGNPGLSRLCAAAVASVGKRGRIIDSEQAAVAGFAALNAGRS